ncbi:predicted protein [Uncinocarpus reesii 1704]|uniref:Uncharacterized protein n=1 Tax=Uncinocarpus reesii (strain UAMH 1704) TaxID=336963 RepID=C4JFD7_UNCRE|nr:uncharacterized protein UREG_00951 [Uncinocarpus reesii 1704]EEP76102.1 predicted protein [Uncinocarpus reesii 1704]
MYRTGNADAAVTALFRSIFVLAGSMREINQHRSRGINGLSIWLPLPPARLRRGPERSASPDSAPEAEALTVRFHYRKPPILFTLRQELGPLQKAFHQLTTATTKQSVPYCTRAAKLDSTRTMLSCRQPYQCLISRPHARPKLFPYPAPAIGRDNIAPQL